MTNKQKQTILLGMGIGIGIGIVAVATAPAWLPAAKARAVQMAAIEGGKLLAGALLT